MPSGMLFGRPPGGTPPETPGLTQEGDPGFDLVEELLGQLEMEPAPEPQKVSVGKTILGIIGDALVAVGHARAGQAPPPVGAFTATMLSNQQQARELERQVDTANREIRNRIRIQAGFKQMEAELRGDLERIKAGLKEKEEEEEKTEKRFAPVVELLSDEQGNYFFSSVERGEKGIIGEPVMIPLPGSPEAPVGRLRRSSQTAQTMETPEGTLVLEPMTKRPQGFLGDQGNIIPMKRRGGPDPGQDPRPKIGTDEGEELPIPPIASEANIDAIQGEQNLLSQVEETIRFALQVTKGASGVERLALKGVSKIPLVGREAVGVISPDVRRLQGSLAALRTAIDEAGRLGRLTAIRKAELDVYIPSEAETPQNIAVLLLDLRENIKRRIAIREKLQPGLSRAIGR